MYIPFSHITLEHLAGAIVFQRGNAYFLDDAVDLREVSAQKVSARVRGSETYRVDLWDDEGQLGYECTCPHANDGYFCKHCVATGLAWLAESSVAPMDNATQKRNPQALLCDYLHAQTPEILIELLFSAAEHNEHFYQRLLRKAELAAGKTDVQKTFRQLITKTTQVRGFIECDEVSDFAEDLAEMVETLEELLTPEQAAILVELSEYAIARVEKVGQQVDDSNGEIGCVIQTLCDLHLQACELAKPEPCALAARLFQFDTSPEFDIASFGIKPYQAVLGELGLQRYRELAEAEWATIQFRQAQDSYDGHRYRITHIMEQLAKISGDVEALVAIKARDLSHPFNYLGIAEIYEQAGQADKALAWAEQGLKAFPDKSDNRLRDFLVSAYLQRQRYDEAIELTWVQFAERPNLEHYKKLYCVAEPIGVWSAQRERALGKVAEMIAHRSVTTELYRRSKPSAPNYSLRLAIALWEEDYDTAWEAAHAGDCEQTLLITLAEQFTRTSPDDAITLYQRVITPIVELTNNNAYAQAIKLIKQIQVIRNKQQRQADFKQYVADLRCRFKPKRNFMKLLDGLKD